ncbi:Uncharacterised protein [Mycobacteroides abscessus subsp. abscessus]|nr:Uncharacterised protein [Mycobacteroides abscessus subsp. abscessus]
MVMAAMLAFRCGHEIKMCSGIGRLSKMPRFKQFIEFFFRKRLSRIFHIINPLVKLFLRHGCYIECIFSKAFSVKVGIAPHIFTGFICSQVQCVDHISHGIFLSAKLRDPEACDRSV